MGWGRRHPGLKAEVVSGRCPATPPQARMRTLLPESMARPPLPGQAVGREGPGPLHSWSF